MQPNIVKAFRSRLLYNKFSNVHICKCGECRYFISCLTPSSDKIELILSLSEMSAFFRFDSFFDLLKVYSISVLR